MPINEKDLKEMNKLLEQGVTISKIAAKFKKYDYWDIHWEVNDYSFLGKKRSITNRLNKLQKNLSTKDRHTVIKEIKELLDGMYTLTKKNGRKLLDIGKIINK